MDGSRRRRVLVEMEGNRARRLAALRRGQRRLAIGTTQVSAPRPKQRGAGGRH